MLPSDPGPLTRRERHLLVVALVMGLAAYSYGLFRYPLYLTDEGIYVQRAWAVLREAQLSPYTYFYDHAPGGWLALASWVAVLPGHFEAFGNPINTGRVLMVPLHLASVFLLFDIGRRFSGVVAAFVATLLFNLSPLGIFYQRQVLLDNFMVFWLLLSVFLIIRCDRRMTAALAGGLAFGMAVITKENAIFFGPVLAFLLYQRVRVSRSRRFAKGFWFFAGAAPVGFYAMYALLKGELLPTGLDFNLANGPGDKVSLAYTVWWQLNRTTPGSPVSGNSMFWQMMRESWLPKDRYLLAAGGIATMVLLVQGLRDWRQNQAELAAALLALCYAVYLMRGSVLLEFYVIPLVPLLALNIGLVFAQAVSRLPTRATAGVVAVALGVLLTPAGGYLLVHGNTGRLQLHDMYRLHLTEMQSKQIDWVEAHVPPRSKIIIDDDMWTTLHDAKPPYPHAHSHYEASGDPAVGVKVFRKSWQNIDYIVMSNKMRRAMVRNNSDGRENWILDALDKHAQRVWDIKQGDVELSVYKVD